MSDKHKGEETIAMPGDADETGDKIAAEQEHEDQPSGSPRHTGGRLKKAVDSVTNKVTGRKGEQEAEERGPLSPAQFDDDGWGDTPVQMRQSPDDEQDEDSKS